MKKTKNTASPLKMAIPIIKVVGDFCNLRCRYCFYSAKDQSARHVMGDELLEKFLSEYMELFSGRLIFIWHGGEPLLAGLPFFQKIINLQTRNLRDGQVIQNNIQTNATLINDEWADFFRVNNFRVGISLDGDRESHDRFRTNNEGKGSFDCVMCGIEILRRHGIEPGIIQTLTQNNVSRANNDFIFFSDALNIKNWGVNDYLDIFGINIAMSGQTITNGELTQFFRTYIDLWLVHDDSDLRIREIENFIFGVINKKALNCTFNGSCGDFFCLEYDGKIYPCDRSSNDNTFLLGDISKQSLLEVLDGSARLNHVKNINSLHPDCVVCEWQNACHNGCATQRIGGVKGKFYYCETRKTVFSYLKKKLKNKEGGDKNGNDKNKGFKSNSRGA